VLTDSLLKGLVVVKLEGGRKERVQDEVGGVKS
jgi:hypothetical protein